MPRTYVTPYRGPVSSLPPGYLQAATAPGRNLAAGIMSAGSSIAEGLEKYAEHKKQEEDKQKAQSAEFKALQAYAKAAGYADNDQTTTMDLPSLKGFVRAKEGESIAQEQQHKLKQYQRAEATDQAVRDMMQVRAVTQGELLPHQYTGLMQSNPIADPLALLKAGKATDPQLAPLPAAHDLNNDGKVDFATFRNSMLPIPEEKVAEIGFKPFADDTGKRIEGVFVDRNGKVIDLRQTDDPYKAALARMLMPEAFANEQAPAAAPAAPPAGEEMWQRFQKRKPRSAVVPTDHVDKYGPY